jgi:hypothetical protein
MILRLDLLEHLTAQDTLDEDRVITAMGLPYTKIDSPGCAF